VGAAWSQKLELRILLTAACNVITELKAHQSRQTKNNKATAEKRKDGRRRKHVLWYYLEAIVTFNIV
jgi:hypothetical protein